MSLELGYCALVVTVILSCAYLLKKVIYFDRDERRRLNRYRE